MAEVEVMMLVEEEGFLQYRPILQEEMVMDQVLSTSRWLWLLVYSAGCCAIPQTKKRPNINSSLVKHNYLIDVGLAGLSVVRECHTCTKCFGGSVFGPQLAAGS